MILQDIVSKEKNSHYMGLSLRISGYHPAWQIP
jgi:hypothetical protein